jgi:RNA polymerase sigma-70 factor (ECF subfamily)
MMPAGRGLPDTPITQLLAESSRGDKAALDRLMPRLNSELRRLAASFLKHERPGHTFQPTDLVNEAYLRLVDQRQVTWDNRAQFFGLAAQMMRRILVNHAEARRTAKRGGGAALTTLGAADLPGDDPTVDVLAINEALQKLATFDPRKAEIVEMRFFAGLTNKEIAAVTGRSTATIERDWRVARAWLYNELHD